MSLTIRIFLSVAFVIAAALGATLTAAGRAADMRAEATVTKALTDALDQVSTQLEERRSALTGQTEVFAKDPDFRATVEGKKPVDLRSQAQDAATQVGANWVQITTGAGIRIAKSNDPRADTVDISGSPFVAGALAGSSKRGYGVDRGTLVQMAAVPIFATAQNRVTGVVMAARALDSAFAASLKAAGGAGVDIALYAFDTLDHADVVASTIGRSAALARQVGSLTRTPPADPARPDSLRREAATSLEIAVGGTRFAALAEPLRSASGAQVGGFIVLRDKDVELAAFDQLKIVILGIGALSLLVAALLSFAIARGVTRPVAQLVDAAQRAADGDYTADIDHRAHGRMRALSNAFRSVLSDLRGRQGLTELLAADTGAGHAVAPPRNVADADPRRHGGLAPGQRFAERYDILEVRGADGHGTVLKAVDGQLGAIVAVKTLKRDVLGNDAGALERFKSEIRLARRISHRNVVHTRDLGEFAGTYFVTMEYVEGTTLDELLRRRGRLTIAAAITVGRQLCRALEAAHAEGVIHGAIDPRNIVIAPDGVVKVTGFGFARQAGDESGDVRAAAAVIYECLTGGAPFIGDGGPGPAGTDATPEPPASRNPEVPRALSELVMRTLFGKPAKRPQTARELHDLLASIS